jgi:hypothetical protein
MSEEYHENAEDAVLTTSQVAPAAKTSNVKTYDKHSIYTDSVSFLLYRMTDKAK